ncbi:ribosome-associated translation inhibitor RaiA [Dissulfurirhabdus thermomarina]|uniref:Ribosome hibernation promoting factor n=1 Tax=Dissulfurirhabdus thermomarina TaxID=1765737 RepID=A0A6N9TMR7_DISTH|nr:ribosome-associated translation inhibitor RaiA [Dissulfurirhabdus thermomarina]NDY41730.1 ribosome-associated translation inhibitor RaiA [Dissulfurirhabdus thermomarina]NMX23666.1 ribosome-associated translation inhibitor RaiA [Dissulfurirhabdus thermomarina]
MRINVTFRHMEPSENLRQYCEQRFKKLKKYADGPMDVNIVLSVEKFRQIAEVQVSGDGIRANAAEEQEDMRAAIDLVSDKIDKQLRRARERLREKKGGGLKGGLEAEAPAAPGEAGEAIRIEPIPAKPMSVDEALAQFPLQDEPFLVFTNAETETVNVLYRRKDDTLGLLVPHRP